MVCKFASYVEQLSGFEDVDAEDAEAPSEILTIIDDATSKENLAEAIIRLEEKGGETKFTEIFKSLDDITDESYPLGQGLLGIGSMSSAQPLQTIMVMKMYST